MQGKKKGPGLVAQFVRVLSRYAKFESSVSHQGIYKKQPMIA